MSHNPTGQPSQRGPFGFYVQPAGPNSFVLHDAHGQPRARWTFPENESMLPALQKFVTRLRPSHALETETAHVEMIGPYPLPIQMFNGKPKAKRRISHNGWLQIGDRRYEITHQFRYYTTMTHNGRVVARGRGQSPFKKPQLVQLHPTDELDQLAIGLLWFLFSLGRTGVISDYVAGLSFI